MTESIDARLNDMAASLAASLGLALWGLEYLPASGRSVLRIYIEAAGRPVDIEDCARLSRHLSVALDVEDLVPGSYTLEISSPGFDRRFFSPEQMSAYLGKEVEITLRSASPDFEGRKKFRGMLKTIEDVNITIDLGDKTVILPWQRVKKARLAA
ncbi:MAG: ribosome maturation factor RimP [Planctomycetes bacterium]|nr:ribosome maturation factor RimP [Planctomycetota bacterium]